MEFSKKLAIAVLCVYTILIFLCVFLITFKSASLEVLLGIVTPIPVSVVGFYYTKAKSENLLKIQQNADVLNQENNYYDESSI